MTSIKHQIEKHSMFVDYYNEQTFLPNPKKKEAHERQVGN